MKLGRRLIALLAVLMLLFSMVPSARAAQNTDYTELEMQLSIANGLRSYDYTIQTWKPLKKAIETGERYLKGKYGQQAVNEAVEDLREAMFQLVKMDYSELENTLAGVYVKIDENPQLHDAWVRMNSAVEKARPLLVSGDQEAVGKAIEELNLLLEEINNYETKELLEPEVVIQEVEVEVLPTGDYCNIPMHRTWPVLFIVSAVLNVVLIIVLIFVIMKKRNTYDDTPLISYDIDDDMDY